MSSVERGCSLECTSRTTISRSSVRAAESLLSGRIQEREYRGRTEMSRKIYNRLSLMAVSWLDESTLPRSPPLTPNGREKCYTRSIWRPAMTSSDDVIVKDPQIMGGAPVFRGTRVPLQALFDYLEGGETLEEFLDGYPSVSREMAIRALEEAKQLLSARI